MSTSIKLIVTFSFILLLSSIINATIKFESEEFKSLAVQYANISEEDFTKNIKVFNILKNDFSDKPKKFAADNKDDLEAISFKKNFVKNIGKMKDNKARKELDAYKKYLENKFDGISEQIHEGTNNQMLKFLMEPYHISYPSVPEDKKKCAICHEIIQSDENISKHSCGNILHTQCWVKWILTGTENHLKCPYCINQVDPVEPSQGYFDLDNLLIGAGFPKLYF